MLDDIKMHPDFAKLLPFAAERRKARGSNRHEWSLDALRGYYSTAQKPAPQILVGGVEEHSVPIQDQYIRVRVYKPNRTGPYPIVMYIHGGGHMMGTLDTHDAPCRLLCQLTDCAVVSVDYRLAPEHKVPTSYEDCYAALIWLEENAKKFDGDPSRLAIAGDSAGGTMTASLCIMARDRKGPKIAFQLMLVPATDADMTANAYVERETEFLYPELMKYFLELMVEDPAAIDYAENSAVHQFLRPVDTADLSGLPPAIVVVAECDLLFDSGLNYAKRLKEAGVPVEVLIAEGMPHQFTSFAHLMPSARVYFEQFCGSLRRALGT